MKQQTITELYWAAKELVEAFASRPADGLTPDEEAALYRLDSAAEAYENGNSNRPEKDQELG